MIAPPIDVVESRLLELGCRPKRQGNAIMAHCPAHEDGTPSLSLGTKDDGTVLVRCQAGCETADVLAALGLEWSDLFASPLERKDRREIVATYGYHDERGTLLYEVVRFDPKD